MVAIVCCAKQCTADTTLQGTCCQSGIAACLAVVAAGLAAVLALLRGCRAVLGAAAVSGCWTSEPVAQCCCTSGAPLAAVAVFAALERVLGPAAKQESCRTALVSPAAQPVGNHGSCQLLRGAVACARRWVMPCVS